MQFLLPLWNHQKEALQKASKQSGFAFFMDAGTGKTATTINWLRLIYKKHSAIIPTLILAPPVVCENWRREFSLHAGSAVTNSVKVLTGELKNRARDLLLNNKQIFITNHESLDSKVFVDAVISRGIRVFVVDESQKLKNPSGKRAKAAHKIADRAQFKLILSGTPVLNSELDLWSQLRILGNGIVPENYFTFRARYFYDANIGMPKAVHFPNWKIKPGAQAELAAILDRYSYQIKKRDCLDLPPLVKQTIRVPLTSEQQRHYEELDRDLITTIGHERTVTPNVITKLLRLQQLCSGVLPSTSSDETFVIPSGKYAALRDVLEPIIKEHKVIIWTSWTDTYLPIANVVESLGVNFVTLTGQTKESERQQNIDRFNNDESTRVIISNPAAGGTGINLISASYRIYFSKTHNLEHYLQSQARNERGGSEVHEKLTQIDLVTESTIEEDIDTSLWKKEKIGEMLTRYSGSDLKLAEEETSLS